jgi:hypothetical protein
MTNQRRQIIPIVGFIATVVGAGYMVAHLDGQGGQPAGDFRNATVAEVHDAQGQIVLRGQFAAVDEEDDDVERKATLTPIGNDPDAAGEAEVEYPATGATQQEIEFSVRNVEPGATLSFFIDGQPVAQATADRQGRAELELDIRMPTSGGSR